MNSKKIIIFPILITILLIANTGYAQIISYEQNWGISKEELQKKLDPNINYTQFDLISNPKYKNKIMNFIIPIDPDINKKILILKLKDKTKTDFLFIKNRLCNTVEYFGLISNEKVKNIANKLAVAYGNSSIQKDDNFTIYAFNNTKTKVLMYVLEQPNGKAKCKVYYYTKKLFRMLIME